MAEIPARPFDRLDYIFKLSVVLTLFVAAAVLASDIIIPMAFAALLSMVMLPVVRKLEARGVGTALSITLVLLLTVVGLGLIIWLAIDQLVGLVNDLPNLQTKLESFVRKAQLTLRQDFGISTVKQTEMFSELMRSVSVYLGDILVTTTSAISTLVQIPIYIFLFLIYRDRFKLFFLRLLPSSTEFRWKKDIEKVVQGYISGLFLVTLIVSFLNTIGLMIVGIDHAIFFGILSGVLTVIPYIGIIIGSLFPILMALITKDSIWYTVGVIIVFTVVQFLEGNFITPRVTGSKVSINALAAIVALLIGGKILGIPGMILSIPGIGVLKIILEYTPRLRPFIILLEDTPIPEGPEIKTKAEKELDQIRVDAPGPASSLPSEA
jgi:predicted PurR-regulated permease PerM